MVNVAVVTAFFAQFTILPPNWQAGSRRETAKLTFLVGGMVGGCRRNGTNAAKRSRIATALQIAIVAAALALIFAMVNR